MSEKDLRALLAEAQYWVRAPTNSFADVSEALWLQYRIDAALAEPVAVELERSPLAPGEGTWAVFAEKVVRERDEARAEVERLRIDASRLEIAQHQWEQRADQNARERDEAFKRGAEAMREAIAKDFDCVMPDCHGCDEADRAAYIRALPVPEDK